MFKKSALVILAAAIGLFFAVSSAHAGAKLKIGDDGSLDLGMRVQAWYLNTDDNVDSTKSGWESFDDFSVRRARFRLKAKVTKWVSAFLQSDGADGSDHKIIDAFVKLNLHPWFNPIMGENMHPGASRQDLTSSGGLLAIGRPGHSKKNLTWGLGTGARFNSKTFNAPGIIDGGKNAVRDTGLAIFGHGGVGEGVHLKYYLGYADGIQTPNRVATDGLSDSGQFDAEDSERIGARVQVNFGDPEPGYYGLATYLGKKQTIGIGVAYDSQDDVTGTDTDGDGFVDKNVDYSSLTVDLFAEQPVGDGAVTFEAGWSEVDLDDAVELDHSAGDGWYAQAGYFINNWQPWIMYEVWDSDTKGAFEAGSTNCFRIGGSYYIKGHNASVKAGYEVYSAEEKGDSGFPSTEDDIGSFLVTFNMTY